MATRVPQPGTPGTQTRILSRHSRVRPKTEGNPEKPRPTIPQSHPSGRGNKKDRKTSSRTNRPTTLENLANLSDLDRKSTRLNSSHVSISYAVFCLKKKKYTRSRN